VPWGWNRWDAIGGISGCPGREYENFEVVVDGVWLFLATTGLAAGYPATVNSGESLVKEMHGRYAASGIRR